MAVVLVLTVFEKVVADRGPLRLVCALSPTPDVTQSLLRCPYSRARVRKGEWATVWCDRTRWLLRWLLEENAKVRWFSPEYHHLISSLTTDVQLESALALLGNNSDVPRGVDRTLFQDGMGHKGGCIPHVGNEDCHFPSEFANKQVAGGKFSNSQELARDKTVSPTVISRRRTRISSGKALSPCDWSKYILRNAGAESELVTELVLETSCEIVKHAVLCWLLRSSMPSTSLLLVTSRTFWRVERRFPELHLQSLLQIPHAWSGITVRLSFAGRLCLRCFCCAGRQLFQWDLLIVPGTADDVIIVACCLHNMLRDAFLGKDGVPHVQCSLDDQPTQNLQPTRRRRGLANKNGFRVRNYFKDNFNSYQGQVPRQETIIRRCE
ncbi:hypothetical protein PR048_031245 [Dryococelus australis]|uniref:DDE Tnp4 domain-containing protein n=1 Tax=Dryococelus australis TaxID=614101 RepID=A0ABQ9G4N9_9NEOP|nr:hypothetical protein PR048_031245 [Dryococelus australis]